MNTTHGDNVSEIWGSYNDPDEDLSLLLCATLHTCKCMYRVSTMLTAELSASKFKVIQGLLRYEPKYGTNILVTEYNI
jgi:hypothetical protein